MLGTLFPPQRVPLIFSLIILPVVFLGSAYYPWKDLSAIRWLQVLSLADPLVYLSEGFRTALTPQFPHAARRVAGRDGRRGRGTRLARHPGLLTARDRLTGTGGRRAV